LILPFTKLNISSIISPATKIWIRRFIFAGNKEFIFAGSIKDRAIYEIAHCVAWSRQIGRYTDCFMCFLAVRRENPGSPWRVTLFLYSLPRGGYPGSNIKDLQSVPYVVELGG
jgi:hypothetical protein